jgi:exonuclease SbcC
MRLHHLTLQAFGPFAGVEQVDFDDLRDAGLFLLTGPTGAGKTTILDAVCFALYGSVPGVRGVKALKSQHAEVDARPEVVLDFSVRERRFLVRRSPEWTRPKRRGDGVTTENATASLLEVTSGEEHLLSSRAQEVGHFIGELVGMQAGQFVQVAMLPQGEFQKFLRATTQERHTVLQHLFRTDRYARIEEWVHEHSRGLKERATEAESEVRRVVDAFADRVDEEPPDLRSTPLVWADQTRATTDTALAAARDHHALQSEAATEARGRYQEGLRLQGLLQRRSEACTTLAELERTATEAEAAEASLAADEAAARCTPMLRLLDHADVDVDQTAAVWQAALQRVHHADLTPVLPSGTAGEKLDQEALTDLEERARSRLGRLEALRPRVAELRGTRSELEAATSEYASVDQEHGRLLARERELPAALAEARNLVERHGATAGRSGSLTLELRQARERCRAATEAHQGEAALASLRDAERDARDRAAEARERVQSLTARRLAGMAAELAGRLEDGSPCQVCGSVEHPGPARSAEDAVTEDEQSEASAALEARQSEYTEATTAVAQARERIDALRAAADQLSPTEARARVTDLDRRLAEAQAAEQDLTDAEESLTRLLGEQQDLTLRRHQLSTRLATLTQTLESRRAVIASLEDEVAALAPGVAQGRSLEDEFAIAEVLVRELVEARAALQAHREAVGRHEDVSGHVAKAAQEHGFDGVAELREAVLPDDARARHRSLVQERADAAARARAVLEDPEVADLTAATPPPDVEALDASVAEAEEREATAAREVHQLEERAAALRRLRARLDERLIAWLPLREESDRADAMARLVRGTGSDNQLQMRLSAYVLATRLDQVVAAANERLAHMRDQRYLLQRTGKAARKGSQAGLGLEVLDQWTGEVRDPSTLSGGETFVVSLALALGLADVVTQEAGGTEIETLFVDEGFGTLDAEMLDDVMDRLDELRAGGRAVGVISHVSELRNRIPAQLHVEKRRNGSSLRVRTAVG